MADLKASGIAVEVFDDVEPDPLVDTARRSAEFARRFAPNGIVGLGGGSPLDIAKATAAILANEAPLEQMWGVGNIPKPALPMILLPTTAGTGSEVTPELHPDRRQAGRRPHEERDRQPAHPGPRRPSWTRS